MALVTNDMIAGWLDIAMTSKIRAANNADNPKIMQIYREEAEQIQSEILRLRATPTPIETAITNTKK